MILRLFVEIIVAYSSTPPNRKTSFGTDNLFGVVVSCAVLATDTDIANANRSKALEICMALFS